MRKAPLFLAAFFVFVTLSRVSNFSAQMGDKRLSITFALGLGAVIFAASYWTQYRGNARASAQELGAIRATIRFSWFLLITATLIDGLFNVADVLSANDPDLFSLAYGITPTVLSLSLGILQARIDALPELRRGSGYRINRSLRRSLLRILDRTAPEEPESRPQHPEPQPEPTPEESEIVPEGYPENGTAREKTEFLLRSDPEITGDQIGEIVGVSGRYGRDLKKAITGSNGNAKR